MLKQYLQLKLSQKLSPQQIQLMKLIELPLQELEERLSREIEENPALESGKENEDEFYENESDYGDDSNSDENDINVEDYLSDDDIPDYRLKTNNYSEDDEEKSMPFVSGLSFNQFLKNQLSTFSLSEEDQKIAEFLVGSVDQSGYIRTELIDIVDDLAFTMGVYTDLNSTERILKKIHLLDPPGVGARDLKECLVIQLKRKNNSKSVESAIDVLENHFELFIKKHYQKIIQKINITEDELRESIKSIPIDRLMIETDSPYLIPRNLSSKPKNNRNEPMYITHIADEIAKLMNVDKNKLIEKTYNNSIGFFT